MSWSLFSRKNKQTLQIEPKNNRLILVAVVLGILTVGVPVFIALHNRPDKYTQSATAAARKQIPNAKVTKVRVAGGFAIATVSDPTAKGQIRDGNMTIFKVNDDGSMTILASGSSFTPLDLLELGIPLKTQAELAETGIDQVMQSLSSACGYTGIAAPGYNGLNRSFSPDDWQIDSGTLDSVIQVLTAEISNKNAKVEPQEKIVCVNASKNNSDAKTDTTTYISTFTLELQFIRADGTIANHVFTFSVGPKYYRNYTLDGKQLTYTPNQNFR